MGIHWANMSGGVVYQEPQNMLQEPFDRDNANSDGGIRVLSISASADPLTLLALSTSLDVSGGLNVKRMKQRSIYDQRLQGSGTFDLSWTQKFAGMSNAYVIPAVSSSDHESQVLNAYRSGSERLETTIVAASSSVYYSKGTKLRHLLYTLTASAGLSSSFGFDPFNISSVGGTASFINLISGAFTTASSLINATIDNYNGIGTWINNGPSQIEQRGRASYIPLSGNYIHNTVDYPARFKINVPERGKIVDIKIWVEFIHDIRGGRGPISGSGYSPFITNGSGEYSASIDHTRPNIRAGAFKRGLGSVVLALRSPNTNFQYCHPLWNGFFQGKFLHPIYTPVDTYHGPEIYKNSYLLWGGHVADRDVSASLGPSGGDGSDGSGSIVTRYPYYAEFDSDIDMRTIFTDSSRWLNPRNLYPLQIGQNIPLSLYSMSGSVRYNLTGCLNDGQTLGQYYIFGNNAETFNYDANTELQTINPKNNYTQYIYGSPSYFAVNMFGLTGSDGLLLRITPTGSNIPWFYDQRIPPGLLAYFSSSHPVVRFFDLLPTGHNPYFQPDFLADTNGLSVDLANLRPPTGWLTGDVALDPNGEDYYNLPASGEFPTYGVQIGPADIQPVYPLLDDLIVEKITTETTFYGTASLSIIPGKKYSGFRPGLRGTEINGTWELMIGVAVARDTNDSNHSGYNDFSIRGSGIWFRQWRLELIVEDEAESLPPLRRAFYKKHNVPDTKRLVGVVSGSAGGWDLGINYVYISPRPNDYGRSYGITDNTSSNLSDFSVFTRLTGALADRLTGSGQAALNAYLHNEFGTPYIPISSGSSITPSLFIFDPGEGGLSRRFISDLLEQKTMLKRSHNLQSVLSRNNYINNTLARRSQILVDLDISEAVSVFSGSYKLP